MARWEEMSRRERIRSRAVREKCIHTCLWKRSGRSSARELDRDGGHGGGVGGGITGLVGAIRHPSSVQTGAGGVAVYDQQQEAGDGDEHASGHQT